jgi:hypothetical protein
MNYIDKLYKQKILEEDFLDEVADEAINSDIYEYIEELNEKYAIENGKVEEILKAVDKFKSGIDTMTKKFNIVIIDVIEDGDDYEQSFIYKLEISSDNIKQLSRQFEIMVSITYNRAIGAPKAIRMLLI